METPFPEDTEHAAWDHDAVGRFGHILDWSDTILEEFSGWFNGKTSPVHFFWHGFDLAVTRFSGRPSGNASDDRVTREAYSHEVDLVRLLAGRRHHDLRCRLLLLHRAGATGTTRAAARRGLVGSLRRFVLPGDPSLRRVRASDDPRRTLLAFCESAYEAGARLADWDVTAFTSSACPRADDLLELQASAAGQFGRALPGAAATHS